MQTSSASSQTLTELSAAGYVLVKKDKPVVAPAADCISTDVKTSSKSSGMAPATSTSLKRSGTVMGLKLGMKPLRIVLPVSTVVTNTAANLCAGVLPIDVTASTEWSALQGLYDEYRFIKGKFLYQVFANTAGFALPGSPADTMFVVAWDPVDATALTGMRNGCELAQHQLLSGFNATTTAALVTVGSFNPSTAVPHDFRWKPMDKSMTISAAGAVTAFAGGWKQLPAAGSNSAVDGYLKFYNYNGLANSISIVSGVLFFEVELRSRK